MPKLNTWNCSIYFP